MKSNTISCLTVFVGLSCMSNLSAHSAELPPVRVAPSGLNAEGQPQLEVTGPAPGVYRLEASPDLINWESIGSDVLMESKLTFTDRMNDTGQLKNRFYRAVLTDEPPYRPGVVLLRFREEANASSTLRAMDAVKMQGVEEILTPSMVAANCPAILCAHTELSVSEALKALKVDPAVEFAEPDYLVSHRAISNDPLFNNGSLWGMYGSDGNPGNLFGSHASDAWTDGYIGSKEVFVGIIDEGFMPEHPDLASNIWINPFDPPNGQDDDGNGYIDDTNGWDFHFGDKTVFDGNPSLPSIDAHGTHVAGTIGAVGGNGQGVAGVNWSVTMIAGKFLGPTGGYTGDAIKAVDYFVDLKIRHGLNIVALNNSWGGGGYSVALHEAILRAAKANILFIAAAGNEKKDNDLVPQYPCNYDTRLAAGRESAADYDAVIGVAAIQKDGELANFSNSGASTVDLAAPGFEIMSTLPWSNFGLMSGTSMATPHVTGAAALYASTHPGTSAAEIRLALLSATIATPNLAGKTVTGGRLSLRNIIKPSPIENPPSAPTSLTATFEAQSSAVHLSWVDNSTNETGFRIERSVSGKQFILLTTVATNTRRFVDTSAPANTVIRYKVYALRNQVSSGDSNIAEIQTPSPLRTIYVDASYTGTRPDGSPTRPFPSLSRAHQDAEDGDTLKVRANVYRERPMLSKRVRIEPLGGRVIVTP